MARLREFDPSTALEKAVDLFWKRGYDNTSMDDLVKFTGVSRYGFYGTFGTKRDLFEASLRLYMKELIEKIQGDLRRPGAKMAEIRGYFDTVMKMADTELGRRGCMLASAAVEVARRDEKMKKVVRELYDGMEKIFRRALRNAAEAGEIQASSREIRSRARYLIGVTQTLSVMLQLGYETKEMREFVETALRAVA